MSISGQKSYSNQQSKQRQGVWGEQTPYLQDLYSQAQSYFNQPNADTSAGYDMQRAYSESPELQKMIGGTQGALAFNLDPSNAGNNPYLQKAMQSAIRPLTQNYQENVLSGITDQAVQAGQSGSSRQGIAEGIAARGYMDQVGDVASQMAYQDYGAGMDRMGRAIDQAGTVANLGMLPSNIRRGVGEQDYERLSRYRDIMGAPTVLGSSESSGGSKSWRYGGGLTS